MAGMDCGRRDDNQRGGRVTTDADLRKALDEITVEVFPEGERSAAEINGRPESLLLQLQIARERIKELEADRRRVNAIVDVFVQYNGSDAARSAGPFPLAQIRGEYVNRRACRYAPEFGYDEEWRWATRRAFREMLDEMMDEMNRAGQSQVGW